MHLHLSLINNKVVLRNFNLEKNLAEISISNKKVEDVLETEKDFPHVQINCYLNAHIAFS